MKDVLFLSNPRRYLLRDEFRTDRAAGTINGSAAEPGPGVRTVVDTENKLSISGRAAVFAGGKASPAWGDPALSYPTHARVAGRAYFTTVAQSNATGINRYSFGPDGSSGGNLVTPQGPSFIFGGVTVAVQGNGVVYVFAITTRAAGAFCFVKGGAFPQYTLIGIIGSPNESSLYFQITNNSAVLTARNIRIPQSLWLPSPIASDSFTRGNGALGVTDGRGHAEGVAGGVGAGGSGMVWTGATWAIATNKAVNTPTVGEELATGTLTVGNWYSITATEVDHFYSGCAVGQTFRATATTALDASNKVKQQTLATLFGSLQAITPDIITDAKVAAKAVAGTQAGIVARLDSAATPANFLICYQDAGNVKLDVCIAGVYTNLATVASAFAVSDTLRLDLSGSAWRLYKIVAAGTATLLGSGTTTLVTGTLAGLFSTDSGNTFAGMTSFAKGTGGEYEAVLNEMSK